MDCKHLIKAPEVYQFELPDKQKTVRHMCDWLRVHQGSFLGVPDWLQETIFAEGARHIDKNKHCTKCSGYATPHPGDQHE